MPPIVILTFAHLLLAISSGLFLGLLALGAGFSDSDSVKAAYGWTIAVWMVLNAPASYIMDYPDSSAFAYLPVQLATSFTWANIYAFVWSRIRIGRN